MDWILNFLCNFTKSNSCSGVCVKLGLHGLAHFMNIPWHPEVFFLSPSALCLPAGLQVLHLSVCVSVSVLPWTQRQKISFLLQMCTWNLHTVSIKQLCENKGAPSFLVTESSYCLLERSRPKWTITVFFSDLEVAAALRSILPGTKSIKGESKICNKSK